MATATEILKYTKDLEFLGRLNHKYMVGLHEILLDQKAIWITSTVHDLAFKIGLDGELQDEWWGSRSGLFGASESACLRELNVKLDFPRGSFVEDYEKYCSEEILHLNALGKFHDSVFILTNIRNAVIQIWPEERIFFCDDSLVKPHNLNITSQGKALINDTGNQKLNQYDLRTGVKELSCDTSISHGMKQSLQFARPGWQRGLTHLENERYLVGTSPAQLVEVNLSDCEVGSRMVLDDDVRHCIHGLLAVETG